LFFFAFSAGNATPVMKSRKPSASVIKGGSPASSHMTRRNFVRAFGAGLSLSAWLLSHPRVQAQDAHTLFEEVPASKSGISFRHVNGRSSEYYLPETTGAGCAFLDYDNDGWLDIYLVNSGKCDFFDPQPPLRNALYRNNRDGTFTDVTD
jgi:enediyne biosynthesis protein E4